jgi:putative ABC transport system ATP-binding protein
MTDEKFTATQHFPAPAVRLRDVCKTYLIGSNEVKGLHNFSLTIRSGEFWAVMGPSGSGKSTLLNLLGCLDKPSTGSYVFGEQDVASLSDDELSELRLQKIGFIFQGFNLIPQLSVRENIELPLHYLGLRLEDRTRRISQLATDVGLMERLDHKPAELSGGQQQRVAIARALVNRPEILLADEPTGNLDSATGEQIMEILATLNRQGRTIVLVTHDPAVASYADHELHMRDGGIARLDKDY